MKFTELTEIELPAAYDAHVHLRDGEMSQLVTPTIRKGGVNQVYVMVSIVHFVSHSGCLPLSPFTSWSIYSPSSSPSVYTSFPSSFHQTILITFL